MGSIVISTLKGPASRSDKLIKDSKKYIHLVFKIQPSKTCDNCMFHDLSSEIYFLIITKGCPIGNLIIQARVR